MKKYDEYYIMCREQCDKSIIRSESMYGKNWWKKYENTSRFDSTDFIKPLVDKNDVPLIKNLTNIYNSEWSILHHMFIQIVIDFIKENDIDDNISSYSININLDKPKKKWCIYLKKSETDTIKLPESEPFDIPSFELISDEKIIEKFIPLNKFIYECVLKFLNDNKNNIPIILNNINFVIDDLKSSVEYGAWNPSSDSTFSAGWDRNGDENADELLVVSF